MSMIDLGRFNQDGVGIPPFAIKSIQQVNIATAIGDVDTTISEVNINSTAVFMFFEGFDGGTFYYNIDECYLSTSTNLKVSSDTTISAVNVWIVEFEPSAVKSFQTGTFADVDDANTVNVTISAVDIDKSIAITNGLIYGETGGNGFVNRPTGVLTTTTNLAISSQVFSIGADGRWFVIEFI